MPTRRDATYDQYIAVAVGGGTGDVAGNRFEQCAVHGLGASGSSGPAMLADRNRLTIAEYATAQLTVFYTPFNDNIQRQRPYGLLGARVENGPRHRRWAVAADGTKPDEHGLRHGDFRDAAHRVCRMSWTFAPVRGGFQGAEIGLSRTTRLRLFSFT